MPWLLLLSACVTGLLPEDGADTDGRDDTDLASGDTDTVRDTASPDLEIPAWTNPGASKPILIEVCALGADSYVAIANPTQRRLDLDGITLARRSGVERTIAGRYDLDGHTLAPGGILVVAADDSQGDWEDTWNWRADVYDAVIGGTGADSYALYTDLGGTTPPDVEKVVDIYGAIGVVGSTQPWGYAGKCAHRNEAVWEASTSWQSDEWVVGIDGHPGAR